MKIKMIELPYTKLIIEKMIKVVEGVEMQNPTANVEFEVGAKYMKDVIVKKLSDKKMYE